MKTSEQISTLGGAVSEGAFSSATLFSQVAFGLVIVLLIVIIGARLFNRIPFFSKMKLQQQPVISVKASVRPGKYGQLTVVEFNQQWLLLGISNENIRCLAKMNKPDSDLTEDETFRQALKKVATQKDENNAL